jgi:glucosamine--fructose-6-phosphate aminotransferase (isomerizing)
MMRSHSLYCHLTFNRSAPLNKDDDVVIVISQSGETADTLAALRLAKSKVLVCALYCSMSV